MDTLQSMFSKLAVADSKLDILHAQVTFVPSYFLSMLSVANLLFCARMHFQSGVLGHFMHRVITAMNTVCLGSEEWATKALVVW